MQAFELRGNSLHYSGALAMLGRMHHILYVAGQSVFWCHRCLRRRRHFLIPSSQVGVEVICAFCVKVEHLTDFLH